MSSEAPNADADADLDALLGEDPFAPPPAAAPAAPRVPIPSSSEAAASAAPTAVDSEPSASHSAAAMEHAVSVADTSGTAEIAMEAQQISPAPAPEATPVAPQAPSAAPVAPDQPNEDTISSSAAEAAAEGAAGWGLSSVTSALGGWGLSTTATTATTTTSQPSTSSTTPNITSDSGSNEANVVKEDDEWKHQTEAVEQVAAEAAASVMEMASSFFGTTAAAPEPAPGPAPTPAPAARENAAAGRSTIAGANEEEKGEEGGNDVQDDVTAFFAGATEFLTGAAEAAEQAASQLGDRTDARVSAGETEEDVDDKGKEKEQPDALRSIMDLNPLSSLASHWIDDLERQSHQSDPHRKLRDHLDAHLNDWPHSTYEEWVEEVLVTLDGWDGGSAVVDDTFYREASVHRNLWNERMSADDGNAGGAVEEDAEVLDGEEGKKKRNRYVPAASSKAAAGTGSGTAASGGGALASAVKARAAAAVAAVSAAGTGAGGGDAGDEDADLDGLIGGDSEDKDEEEIVFVGQSPPNSGVLVSPPSGGL